ncbi:hypothetical protein JB92DRAFT_3135423 [Gautieria morchelliformis]|nr:hypothetical protein JB92DRAFT_3135423 [Gautieria morchelliformis]
MSHPVSTSVCQWQETIHYTFPRSVTFELSVARNKLYLVGQIEMNHSESVETQGNPAAMRGPVTSVLQRFLLTSIAPTDDPLQTPITLSLEELLAISPAISDGLLRSFQDDKSPESIVCYPPTPSPSLPVVFQPPSNSVPSLSVLSHRDIPYVPCLTVIRAPGNNQSGVMSQHTCATCSRAFSTTRRLKRHTRVHRVVRKDPQLHSSQSYGLTPTSSCTASSAPSHARIAPRADASRTFPPTVPCTATTRRNAGIGAAHGNSATLETFVQTCDVVRQSRTDMHLHARACFPLYPTPPFPSSCVQYTPTHFSRCHHSCRVPSTAPFSSSPPPYIQKAPTHTPLAATTCVLTHNVTQRHRRTEMQKAVMSHEIATLTETHTSTHVPTMTCENATHPKDAARQTRETTTEVQKASHSASTRTDMHALATTSPIRHAQMPVSQLHSQHHH